MFSVIFNMMPTQYNTLRECQRVLKDLICEISKIYSSAHYVHILIYLGHIEVPLCKEQSLCKIFY